jgi:hypothetical protein
MLRPGTTGQGPLGKKKSFQGKKKIFQVLLPRASGIVTFG